MAERVQGWRKLARAAWGPPMDPQFYGELEIDAAALLAYVEYVRRSTSVFEPPLPHERAGLPREVATLVPLGVVTG
jgi:hypothetical protein